MTARYAEGGAKLIIGVTAPREAGSYELTISVEGRTVTAQVEIDRRVSVTWPEGRTDAFRVTGQRIAAELTPADFGLSTPEFARSRAVTLTVDGSSEAGGVPRVQRPTVTGSTSSDPDQAVGARSDTAPTEAAPTASASAYATPSAVPTPTPAPPTRAGSQTPSLSTTEPTAPESSSRATSSTTPTADPGQTAPPAGEDDVASTPAMSAEPIQE